MTRESTFGASSIRRQFSELAGLLDEDLTVYLVGGGALTLADLKNATKDVDLVVRTESEIRQLWNLLRAAGYEPPAHLSTEYHDLRAVFILEKGQRRFDVFCERVAGELYLSDPMASRSQQIYDEAPLTVRAVSLDDIFLFKAVANREDDIDDMIRIAQRGIDEDRILGEIETQLERIGRDEFIGAMKHKLDRLEKRGYVFGIHAEIDALYSQSRDGKAVRDAITDLLEFEHADDLYEGVPRSSVERLAGTERTESGIAWLEKSVFLSRVLTVRSYSLGDL